MVAREKFANTTQTGNAALEAEKVAFFELNN